MHYKLDIRVTEVVMFFFRFDVWAVPTAMCFFSHCIYKDWCYVMKYIVDAGREHVQPVMYAISW